VELNDEERRFYETLSEAYRAEYNEERPKVERLVESFRSIIQELTVTQQKEIEELERLYRL
jgi:hypothetical protein